MTKWVKTKIIFSLTVVLVTTTISLVLLDPLYPTNERVIGVVTQSVQMFPVYGMLIILSAFIKILLIQ